jgi:NAD(P)-dependent dehydrogenase (short-subunit alcohol dehydrogenase family)
MGSVIASDLTHLASASSPALSLFSLSNRTILITGAGRGLGLTLAHAVIEAGGSAACIDVLPSPAAEDWANLQASAKKAGVKVSYHKCDITNEEDLSKFVDIIESEGTAAGSPLFGAIACAGIQQKILAVEYPVDEFRRIMDVNVVGTFLTIKHAARIFIREGRKGSIVMIASMSGQVANRVCFSRLFVVAC